MAVSKVTDALAKHLELRAIRLDVGPGAPKSPLSEHSTRCFGRSKSNPREWPMPTLELSSPGSPPLPRAQNVEFDEPDMDRGRYVVSALVTDPRFTDVQTNLIKNLLTGILASSVAVFIGIAIADANYLNIALLAYLAIGIAAVVIPGTSALLALGLLAPFTLPIPIVHGFPFILLITMLCYLKLFLTRIMTSQPAPLPRPRIHWLIGLFFFWVAIRYAMNPALPNLAGIGSNVTGFRSYLHYGTSLVLILGMPWFLPNRFAIVQFVRWCGLLSLAFSMLFIFLSFSRSTVVIQLLNQFGMFVATFDNGMLRFVTLPAFGVMLISLSLIPDILGLPGWQRKTYLTVGLLAVLFGGSRSGFIMLYALVAAIAIGRRKLLELGYWTAIFICCFFVFRYAGEHLLPKRENVGVMRILSVASAAVAERTDAAANSIWRQVRWERALQEIRSQPLLGTGYGGLDRAFVFASREEYEQARLEIDVASGNIHNGYISAAMALGVPAALLFVAILALQLIKTATGTRASIMDDAFSRSFYTLALAHLSAVSVSILIGTDINRAAVWWWLQFAALPAYVPLFAHQRTTPGPAERNTPALRSGSFLTPGETPT